MRGRFFSLKNQCLSFLSVENWEVGVDKVKVLPKCVLMKRKWCNDFDLPLEKIKRIRKMSPFQICWLVCPISESGNLFLRRISLFLKLQVHVKMTTGLGHAGHIIFLGFFCLLTTWCQLLIDCKTSVTQCLEIFKNVSYDKSQKKSHLRLRAKRVLVMF